MMKLADIRNIAVLGGGIMGHGIAQIFLMGGYPVSLFDIEESVLKTATARIKNSLSLFREADLIESSTAQSALEKLHLTLDLKQATEAADFIVEAIPEDLSLKQDLFEHVETLCGPDTIIASNTSSLTLKQIGARVQNKKRLIITHWFNPPQLVPAVEVVKGDETIDEVVDITCELLERIKKAPVRLHREIPGFLVNRIQIAMAREVLDLYEKGIASAEDIDEAVKGSIGFRLASIGPLLTMDLGGLEIWSRVLENLLPHIQHSTKPPKVLKRLVDQGHKGIKSGKGFYDYGLDFSKGQLEGVIKRRDQEFLDRLRNLYWTTEKRDK
jgi:3-hydroxyacyl-CoA dehydrogenase